MTLTDEDLGPLATAVSEPLRGVVPYHVPTPTGIVDKLDANELPYAWPPELIYDLTQVLVEVALETYPDAGAQALRARVAAQDGVAEDQLVFGNGSDELIAMLVNAFAAPRPGAPVARVLYPVPTFVYYRLACQARGVAPVEVPLGPDFAFDGAAVRRALIETRPNLAFFALPNNPTGGLWPMAEVRALAVEFPETLFVSDEAYFAYSRETLLGALATTPNLVVMRTLSKIGLASLRVGYLCASPAIARVLERVRPPYNLGGLAQAAATFALSEARPWIAARTQEVIAAREPLAEALNAAGLHVYPSRANLLLVRVGTPGDGAAQRLWQRLTEAGILVRNFDRPGPLQGHLRITVGRPEQNARVIDAVRAVLDA